MPKSVLCAVLILVVLPACAVAVDPTGDVRVEADQFVRWDAQLEGQAGFEEVRGTARANSGFGQTGVAVSIAGAPAGGTHPWHIHRGTCATGGPIVGAADAYPALRPGTDGRADGAARISVSLDHDQEYHVNVHASPNDLGTIVACGELRR
jgi:hypothetical protein